MTDREIESHYYDIYTVLLNTFLSYSYAIIVLEGYMMALIKQTDFSIYLTHMPEIPVVYLILMALLL